MFLFAEQDADVVVQEPLQSTFLHAILFCNMCRLCRGERTGKLADNGLLLVIQCHFAMIRCTLKADSLKYSVSRMARSTVSKSI